MRSEGLGEGYDGDIAFASTLETFGGGHNDPISVAFGGTYPYICKSIPFVFMEITYMCHIYIKLFTNTCTQVLFLIL